MKGIGRRAAFTFVRYSNCWEDASILVEALRPGTGMHLLSIASAGDNAFALLAAGAAVTAVDLNPAQLALVELKREAIRRLPDDELMAFLGVRPTADRLATWHRLASSLGEPARRFWSERPRLIEQGVIHCGKFERYFRLFRRFVLPLLHPRRVRLALLEPKSCPAREAFYRDAWDNRRWRGLFRLFFSRMVMGRLGRDPEFFRFVEEPVGTTLLRRVGRALAELPGEDNPFLDYILTGTFSRVLPDYLRPPTLERLRGRLDDLELVEAPLERVLGSDGRAYNGFNLSDIFEYLDEETCRRLHAAVVRRALPGARIAYWNMLATRSLPAGMEDRVTPRQDLADALFARDRAFFYRAFRVEEVTA